MQGVLFQLEQITVLGEVSNKNNITRTLDVVWVSTPEELEQRRLCQ